MSHTDSPSHVRSVRIRLGDRGRLVLPAELRRAAGFQDGDELTVSLEADGMRIVGRRELARSGRGSLAHLKGDRDLIGELLNERRAEAAREELDVQAPAEAPST